MTNRFNEYDQTIRSTVMFKWKNIKLIYLKRHKRIFMSCTRIFLSKCKNKLTEEKLEVDESEIAWSDAKKIRDGECDEI